MNARSERFVVAQSGASWDGEAVLSEAARHLATGGSSARREVVRTILGLERLLRTTP